MDNSQWFWNKYPSQSAVATVHNFAHQFYDHNIHRPGLENFIYEPYPITPTIGYTAMGAALPLPTTLTQSPSLKPYYSNTVLTDVGICFGMRNVNLNSDLYSKLLPVSCSGNRLYVIVDKTTAKVNHIAKSSNGQTYPAEPFTASFAAARCEYSQQRVADGPRMTCAGAHSVLGGLSSQQVPKFTSNPVVSEWNSVAPVVSSNYSGYRQRTAGSKRPDRDNNVTAPKKKWIRHYLRGMSGRPKCL